MDNCVRLVQMCFNVCIRCVQVSLWVFTRVSPLQFFRQVKQEVKKVTWPTKKEVLQTSLMVVVLVSIAATFFFFVDQILGWGIKLILGLGE